MERKITRTVSRDQNHSQLQRVLREKNNVSSSSGSTPKQNSPVIKSAQGFSKIDLKFWEESNSRTPEIYVWGETEDEYFGNGSSICDQTIYPSSSGDKEITGENILDESFYDSIYSTGACGELLQDDNEPNHSFDFCPLKSSRESSGLTLVSQIDSYFEDEKLFENIDKLIYQEPEMSSSFPKQKVQYLNKSLKSKHSMPEIDFSSSPTLRSHPRKASQKFSRV